MGIFSALFDGIRSNENVENCKSSFGQISKEIPTKKETNNRSDLNNLVVYAPKNMNEVVLLVDCMKNHETCIVDLCGHNERLKEKILNFLSGAICALDGAISRLQGELYIITPKNINIATL